MKLNILFSLVLLMSPNLSWADKMGPNGDKFYEAAARFEGACGQQTECRPPFSRKVLYSQKSRVNKLSDSVRVDLKAVVDYQTQIWGDTILEGDYVASGRPRLDEVIAYYRDSELQGYKMRYSEKAWYTGECAYNGTRASLANCKEGRIAETSYVSPDMETFFSDEEQFAQFLMIQ